jgi:hypothetical protein
MAKRSFISAGKETMKTIRLLVAAGVNSKTMTFSKEESSSTWETVRDFEPYEPNQALERDAGQAAAGFEWGGKMRCGVFIERYWPAPLRYIGISLINKHETQ